MSDVLKLLNDTIAAGGKATERPWHAERFRSAEDSDIFPEEEWIVLFPDKEDVSLLGKDNAEFVALAANNIVPFAEALKVALESLGECAKEYEANDIAEPALTKIESILLGDPK